MVDLADTIDKHLIPDLAAIVLEYCQLEHVNKVFNGYRYVYTKLFGKKHGKSKGYFLTDELAYICHYVDGKLHGEYKFYYTTGELWHSCHWIIGKRHGEWKFYSPIGEMYHSEHWIHGVKQ